MLRASSQHAPSIPHVPTVFSKDAPSSSQHAPARSSMLPAHLSMLPTRSHHAPSTPLAFAQDPLTPLPARSQRTRACPQRVPPCSRHRPLHRSMLQIHHTVAKKLSQSSSRSAQIDPKPTIPLQTSSAKAHPDPPRSTPYPQYPSKEAQPKLIRIRPDQPQIHHTLANQLSQSSSRSTQIDPQSTIPLQTSSAKAHPDPHRSTQNPPYPCKEARP